ncbi:hypothetical protein Patl1_07017 [Pistacia atlantica]|uniref:Uncharacterized protein n=1 Tax=Pistacia atlantica TaxID=434234 RepID=A0ACC1AGT9_9ROSI|nr:hypothetical protein Patl1_07017 [Pistacia atlantica]
MEVEEKDKEKLVFMWGYLSGALPQRSPVVVRLPATVGSAWKDVCGGGCEFAMAISALYFVVVATIAALIGQHIGGVGISNIIEKIEAHDYMGFENLSTYDA